MKIRIGKFTPGISHYHWSQSMARMEVHIHQNVIWFSITIFNHSLFFWLWDC